MAGPKERETHHHALRQHSLTLWRHYTTCTDPKEQAVILLELRGVDRQLQRHEIQAEQLAQLPDVWETIYGPGPGFLSLFSGQRGARRLEQTREAFFAWPADVPRAQRWLDRELTQDRELYQCTHLLAGWRRQKRNAAPLHSLWVDLDSGQLSRDVAPPTVIVESSPGRLHAYWRLNTPLPPPVGEQLNRQLAYSLGADKSGWDLTQLLRVPGSVNHKYDQAPLVQVVGGSGKAYATDELFNPLSDLPLFQSPDRESVPLPTSTGGGDADPHPPALDAAQLQQLSRTAQQIWRGDAARLTPDGEVDRSRSLLQIARVLSGMGLTRAQMVTALAERDETLGWRKYSDRQDALKQYEHLVDVVTQPLNARRKTGR